MTSFAAVIVETRPMPWLNEIIEAHARYLPKDCDILMIDKEPINSIADYNRLLTSKRFWRHLSEKVLIFQTDSEIFRTGIEDFLEFDFCGANIKKIPSCFNGGLSIRDKKAMLKVIETYPYQGESISGNEDIHFCNSLLKLNAHLPSYNQANKFSVETEFHLGSIGAHAIDRYLSINERNAIRNQYL